MREKLEQLAREWHEAGRREFETRSPNLDYDSYYPKKVLEKAKYFYLNEGNSGAFLVEKETGNVYRLKSAYGVPNKRKCLGHYEELTGERLHVHRWW